jgi:hypothetical protein
VEHPLRGPGGRCFPEISARFRSQDERLETLPCRTNSTTGQGASSATGSEPNSCPELRRTTRPERKLLGQQPAHLPVRDAPQSVIGSGVKAPVAWRNWPLEGLLRAGGAGAPVCGVCELYQTGPLTALLLRPR